MSHLTQFKLATLLSVVGPLMFLSAYIFRVLGFDGFTPIGIVGGALAIIGVTWFLSLVRDDRTS